MGLTFRGSTPDGDKIFACSLIEVKRTVMYVVYVSFDYLTTFCVAQIYDLYLPFPFCSVYLVVATIKYAEQCMKIGMS